MDFKVWLRRGCIGCNSCLAVWHSFMKINHLFIYMLTLRLGTGHHIHIGRDSIWGLEDINALPNPLVHSLNHLVIFFLQQVIMTWHNNCPIWKRSTELRLHGQFAKEWESIHMQFHLTRIRRYSVRDSITW